MSLKQKYQALCQELQVKCNSAVVKQLPDDDGKHFTAWNLSGNVVGTRGATAVVKLAAQMPTLQSLNLKDNNLGSAVTKDLLAYLVSHPSLVEIDLSLNDVRLGGPELVELLKKNRKITVLNVDGTHLRPLFTRLIAIQLRKNGGGAPAAAEGKTTRFSFGDPASDHHDESQAADDSTFAAFQDDNSRHIAFTTDSAGGKRVPRRPTVCSEVYKEEEVDNFVPEVVDKDTKTVQWLMSVLEHHDLFSHLEDFELSVAVAAMNEGQRAKGDTIFEEGDEDCDLFYIIGSGEVEIKSKGEVAGVLTRGASAQDLMLLYPAGCTETATCLSDVTIYSLDRKTYRCVLSKASKKKRAMYSGFLEKVNFLKGMSQQERLQLADALKPSNFEPGASLIKYGEVGEAFFLIVEGVVEVYGRNDAKESIKVCEFSAGDCVGELEFINNHVCVADVKAKTFVRTAKMNRHHFELVMGPVKEVLARTAQESTVYTYYRTQLNKMEKEHDH